MKIDRIEPLHADGAWRNLDFLKITTDTGIVGWSEYNESFGGQGVTAMIQSLVPILIGQDAAATRRSPRGCMRAGAPRRAASPSRPSPRSRTR